MSAVVVPFCGRAHRYAAYTARAYEIQAEL